MTALLGAIAGILAASGAWLVVAGIRGAPVPDGRRPLTLPRNLGWRALSVIVSFLAIWAVTSWPAAGVLAGAAAAVVPVLLGAGRRRRAQAATTEALASWAEMLRDSITAHAGLREAIVVTATVAPQPIRSDVQHLAVAADRAPLAEALRQFADRVDDPVADLIVSAMVIAAERQAERLADLLTEIAAAARAQSSMRLRVETGRARLYASSKALVIITFCLAAVLLLFSPEFMAPYDTAAGQMVMLLIGGFFAAALVALVEMGKPARIPRVLGTPTEGGPS